jgi:hypothetical protein
MAEAGRAASSGTFVTVCRSAPPAPVGIRFENPPLLRLELLLYKPSRGPYDIRDYREIVLNVVF